MIGPEIPTMASMSFFLVLIIYSIRLIRVDPYKSCSLASLNTTIDETVEHLRENNIGYRYDVAETVIVKTLSFNAIPLYSQYLSINENGISQTLPVFILYEDSSIEESIGRFCLEQGTRFYEGCFVGLSAALKRDRELLATIRQGAVRALTSLRRDKLLPDIDIDEIAADSTDLQNCTTMAEKRSWRKAFKSALISRVLPPLRVIALDTGADLEHHGYDILLSHMYGERLRLQPLRILEIGLGNGAGLHTWRRFFPAARLHSVERLLPPACLPCDVENGVLGWVGDTSNQTFLEFFLGHVGGRFDLILDDGGHVPAEQLLSWTFLFRHGLKPGGNYLIMDIETSYWKPPGERLYGKFVHGGVGLNDSLVEAFKELADSINGIHSKGTRLDDCTARLVEHFTFTRNAIALRKRAVEVRPHHPQDCISLLNFSL